MQSKKSKSCSCGTSKHPNVQSMTLQVICCSPGEQSSKDFDIYFQMTTQGLPNTCWVYWAFEAPVIMLKLFWLIKSINRKHFSVLGAHAFSGQEHRVFSFSCARVSTPGPAPSCLLSVLFSAGMRFSSQSRRSHICQFFTLLFSNAEVFEDDVQDLLCPDPSSDPAQAGDS